MSLLVLVVDDEPDVEIIVPSQFRHDLRAGRFTMEFAPLRADLALQRISRCGGRVDHPDPVRHQHAREDRSGTVAEGQGSPDQTSRS